MENEKEILVRNLSEVRYQVLRLIPEEEVEKKEVEDIGWKARKEERHELSEARKEKWMEHKLEGTQAYIDDKKLLADLKKEKWIHDDVGKYVKEIKEREKQTINNLKQVAKNCTTAINAGEYKQAKTRLEENTKLLLACIRNDKEIELELHRLDQLIRAARAYARKGAQDSTNMAKDERAMESRFNN